MSITALLRHIMRLRPTNTSLPTCSSIRVTAVAVVIVLFLLASTQAGQVTLDWQDDNNDPSLVSYYILYYWQSSWSTAESVNVGNQTTYTLTDLEAGQTYHFSVTAYDHNGDKESDFSSEVSITIPYP